MTRAMAQATLPDKVLLDDLHAAGQRAELVDADLAELVGDCYQQAGALLAENERLKEALRAMVREKCSYMLLNDLGDPEAQHTVKLARAALAEQEGK